ncbi:MAG TPA: VWA domain-containing protein [Opitutus sp.]|nr:VWA domain-containing protein [Opitutus sp.]
MTFASPQLLWLLLIPISLFIMELARRRRTDVVRHSKILRAEAGAHSLKLTPTQAIVPVRRTRIHPWLCAGLVLAIGAAARPQWGRLEEPVFDQAREILIAIDLSRSMLTPDVKPSRLDRAKLLTQSLLEKLVGERVGLVVYSGTAFLQSPLSADYEILREFLPELNPEFLPEGGTNYRALIDTSLDAFGSTAAADRFLIVLSDGEATTDDWRERIPELKKKGIRVIGLGVGTPEGAMIPDGAGGLVKDERGAVVMSKLESATLRELADETNGAYQDASNWIDLAALVTATVESGKQGEFMEKNTIRLVERFQWPLAFALWCLFVSFYYEIPVRPRPRDLKLTTEPVSPKSSVRPSATALILCALFVYNFLPSPALAASEPPETPPLSPLARIVARLSSAPQTTARDWAELARETVTWGSKLQSSQQPIPDGPIRDALTAVDLGSKLDQKTADWPKLREELEALRKKSEEEQQDQEQKNEEQKKDQQQSKQQDQKQDQQKQDQQKKDSQEKQNSEPQQQKEQSESDSSSDQKEQKDPASEPSEQEKDSAFGDMKKNEQPPPPPTEDTQQVGGAPKDEKGEPLPIDPNLAVPLQKLDQLKNQDSPAELFRLLEGEKDRTPRKKTKDW